MDLAESQRVLAQMPFLDEQYVIIDELERYVRDLVDHDLQECINRGFEKLDIDATGKISASQVQQALASSIIFEKDQELSEALKRV